MKFDQLLEPHLIKKSNGSIENCKWQEADNLLTPSRIDICLKLAYLEIKNKNKKYAELIYKSDICMQTKGSFKEIGNVKKKNIEDYINSFNEISSNMKVSGFDEKKSLIPVSKNGNILNGAHRIASAIHFGLKVKTATLPVNDVKRDFLELFKRNLEPSLIELAATIFVNYSKNSRVAFFWPRIDYDQDKESNGLDKIFYKKKVNLSGIGKRNLIQLAYSHIDFSSEQAKSVWIDKKVSECFSNGNQVTVFFFQSNNDQKVKEFKRKIRDKYKCGYSIIHTTDTHDEAKNISGLLLNDNGIHFINNSTADLTSITNKVKSIKYHLEKNSLDRADVAVDSGFILEMYGLRKSRDIDLIHYDNQFTLKSPDIDIHQDTLVYHQVASEELVFNPYFYFEFHGIKFISLEQVYYMKAVRNEEKDRTDTFLVRKLNRNGVLNPSVPTGVNTGLLLNKQLFKLYEKIDSLKDNSYVVYGAGTGSRIICSHMGSRIKIIVDSNKKFHGMDLYGIKIHPTDEIKILDKKIKVIISVFGREKEIAELLINNYHLEKERIITFSDII